MATNPYMAGTAQAQQWDAANSASAKAAPYAFDPTTAFGGSQDWLNRYSAAIPAEATPAPDLQQYINAVGPYQCFYWATAGAELLNNYKAPTYQTPDYVAANPYQKTNYNFADSYQAPSAYQSFNFHDPNVDDVQSVQPISDQIYEEERTRGKEDISNRYKDIASQARDELIRTGKRPEQSASVLANIAMKADEEKRANERDLAISRAQQDVGIAQNEQGLKLQRGLAVAGMDQQTQESMAQELAKTYGMSVDAARYMVQQQQAQQTAQAGENQYAYGTDATEAARKTGFNTEESQYGYSAATDAARYQSALEQWTKEQEAANAQQVWQSQYGQAQDQTQTALSQWQAGQAAKIDQANMLMQGTGAAQTGAAQQATYWTNLNPNQQKQSSQAASQPAQYSMPKPTYSQITPSAPVGGYQMPKAGGAATGTPSTSQTS